MNPEFETERLILKPVGHEDLEIFFELVTDEFIRSYLFDDEILARNQVADLITTSDETFGREGFGLWLISLSATSEVIGFTGLWRFFDERQPQLLYALLPGCTGKGLAAEASRRIIEYAFSELGFEYLDASCDLPNRASQKTAGNLGMKLRKQETVDGKPTVFFRLEKI